MRAMRYPPADLADVDDDIRAQILEVADKSGFVPNVYLALARRPAELRAFFAYYDALLDKGSGNRTKADGEMIVVASAAVNRCLYCVVARGARLRIFQNDASIAGVVATNYRQADISARQSAMLDFAVKVCEVPWAGDESDHAGRAELGSDDEGDWDKAAITGFFGLRTSKAPIPGQDPNRRCQH